MKQFFTTGAAIVVIAFATASVASAQEQEQPIAVTKPLGATQNAWNEQLRRRGESQSNPGYVRYIYNPANVFPIRTRESMITTIKLPDTEELLQAFSGDDQGFQVGIATPNSIAIKALYPGVDTNLVAYTKDGKIFTFYIRSEGYNSKSISDFLVDVIMPGEAAVEGSRFNPSMNQAENDAKYPAQAAERIRDPYASLMVSERGKYREYAEWSDFRPGTVREDLGVYVPKEKAGGMIPYRVFRDDRFTYVDYGPNATQSNEWPTPLLVVQGVEGPVGFRTAGPGGRMIVMEALGSFVLRNGQRMIVIKPKTDVVPGDNSLIEYPVSGVGQMQVPTDLPPGRPVFVESDPKTVVATNGPVTRNGESPSEVKRLPAAPSKLGKRGQEMPRQADGKKAVVEEIPAPAPAAPIRTVVVNSPGPDAAAQAASIAMGAAPNAGTAVAQGVLKPTMDATAISGYKVVLGRGSAAELEDKWKSYRVQHYDVLSSKQMKIELQSDGTSAMAIMPILSIAEGMRLCTSLGNDGANCTVKTVSSR